MCKKKQFKYCPSEIDECMKKEIISINKHHKVLACCCGHGKYPKTIIVKSNLNGMSVELFSKQYLPRKKKFYKRDKQGYYYIPETLKE